MNVVYLGLGSNVDAFSNIRSGIDRLKQEFGETELSPVYRSPAMGFDGDDFLNLVARIKTDLAPLPLKNLLAEIENQHGRRRDVPRFSDRSLDIDILLFNDLVLISPLLEIPRKEILTSAHVLKPLADLAPAVVHPVLQLETQRLWQEYPSEKDHLVPVNL